MNPVMIDLTTDGEYCHVGDDDSNEQERSLNEPVLGLGGDPFTDEDFIPFLPLEASGSVPNTFLDFERNQGRVNRLVRVIDNEGQDAEARASHHVNSSGGSEICRTTNVERTVSGNDVSSPVLSLFFEILECTQFSDKLQSESKPGITVCLYQDSSNPPQFNELVALTKLKAIHISHEDVIHAKMYLNWDGILRNETGLVMSQTSFSSVLYHGLLKPSNISLIVSENFDDSGLIATTLSEVLSPSETLPPIFSIQIDGVVSSFNPLQVVFRSITGLSNDLCLSIGLPEDMFRRFADIDKLETLYNRISTLIGSWAGNRYLCHELSDLLDHFTIEFYPFQSESYSGFAELLKNKLSNIQRQLDVTQNSPNTHLPPAPAYHLWGLLLQQMQHATDGCFIVLVSHHIVATYLGMLLQKLASVVPELNVHSETANCPDKGWHISVCTLDAFVAISNPSCTVYVLERFPSVVHFMRLRSQLAPFFCNVVIPVYPSDPIITYIQAIEKKIAIGMLAQYTPRLQVDTSQQVRKIGENATLSLTSAKLFLEEYCKFASKSERPMRIDYNVIKQDKGFFCKVTFPPSHCLPSLDGTLQSTRKCALKIAVWMACLKLHQVGSLDFQLLPLPSLWIDLGLPVIETGRHHILDSQVSLTTKVADFWSDLPTDPGQIYLNQILMDVQGYCQFALATHAPLPKNLQPVTLNMGGFYADVRFLPSNSPVPVSPMQISLLTDFTNSSLTLALKKYMVHNSTLPYYFVPLKGKAIDWDQISLLKESSPQILQNWGQVYMDRGFQLYHIEPSQYSSITDVTGSRLEIQRNYIKSDLGSLLSNHEAHSSEVNISPGSILPVKMNLDVAKSACLVPSIMKRLEDNLLALEVKAILDLDIKDNLLMEALTFCNSNIPTTMKVMEFYGDSFLNMMVCFVPFLGGAQSSIRPGYLMSNNCLIDLAQSLGISSRINGRDLDHGWVPPNHPASLWGRSFAFKTKFQADAMEAILGAALLSGGEALGIRCLISFGIWPLRANTWPHILNNSLMVSQPTSGLGSDHPEFESLEALIGYTFRHKTTAKMVLESKYGLFLSSFFEDRLFKFTAVRYLIKEFPFMTPMFFIKRLDLFNCSDSYSKFQSLAGIQRSVMSVLGQTIDTQSGFFVLKQLIMSVFFDSHLHFSEVHRLFHPIYASIFADRNFGSLDFDPDLSRIVARMFFQVRCSKLRAFCFKNSITGAPTVSLLIHDQTVATKSGISDFFAFHLALKEFMLNHTSLDFIRRLCSCKNYVAHATDVNSQETIVDVI